MQISGKNIIVTGAASGLGLAFARTLASHGGIVWAVDRDRDALATASTEHDVPDRLRFELADVSQPDEIRDLVSRVDEWCGGVDVLINNAAVLKDQTLVSRLGRRLKKHSIEDWNDTIASNLTGTFLAAREVVATMIQRRRHGLVVNISSISRRGNPGQSAYAASKAAIDALTVTWSQELAVYGIRVAGIAPGFVETAMTRRIPQLHVERLRERTPLKRFGSADELAHAVTFIVENDYVNGRTIEVDGGLRF